MLSRRALLFALAVSSSAAIRTLAAESGAPFGIDRRPRPTTTNPDALLPAKVGAFVRDPLPAGAQLKSDEDLNVAYRAGKDSVDLGVSKPDSVADVRDAIQVARDEAVQSNVPMAGARVSLKTDPAYFHAHDFIAWGRGTYFFYAKASSPAVLAKFMEEFPY